MVCLMVFFFFFKSRSGHTSLTFAGISALCSPVLEPHPARPDAARRRPLRRARARPRVHGGRDQIGRASCRERGRISVVAVTLKKKQIEDGQGSHESQRHQRKRGEGTCCPDVTSSR